jgi:serine/threonine-protein phosphatase PPG1
MYGGTALKLFLNYNGLKHLSRAHQLCMEGYQLLFDNKMSTVWSAPNYCGKCGNLASILEIDENLVSHFNIFQEAPTKERKDPLVPPPEYFL